MKISPKEYFEQQAQYLRVLTLAGGAQVKALAEARLDALRVEAERYGVVIEAAPATRPAKPATRTTSSKAPARKAARRLPMIPAGRQRGNQQ